MTVTSRRVLLRWRAAFRAKAHPRPREWGLEFLAISSLRALCFQLRHARFQLCDQFARAREHRALRVKLLARDQIEAPQPMCQHVAEIRLQVFARGVQARWYQRGEPLRELVDTLNVDHGRLLELGNQPMR